MSLKFEEHKFKALIYIFLLLIPFIFSFGYLLNSKIRLNEITIKIHVPKSMNLVFYDIDNVSIICEYNYSIFLIMISGKEKDIYPICHIHHFIDDRLLAYFLDIELYNLSSMQDEYLLNGKVLSWSFTYNRSNLFFGIEAFDFSIFNETTQYNFMDFGNSPFLDLNLGNKADIYLNEFSCFRVYEGVYRPYLNFSYNNQLYLEKSAWNNTILF